MAEPDDRGMFVSTLKDHEPTFKDVPTKVEYQKERSQSVALPQTEPVVKTKQIVDSTEQNNEMLNELRQELLSN